MTNQSPSLRIGLLDNSYHSLKRGYELWGEWKTTENAWLLKESIFWVHHGIELALKRLLVQTNEFLVFEDINKAVQALGNLRQKDGMSDAGVLDLFDHDVAVKSVNFSQLIDRVAITLSIPELAKNSPLRLKIDELTKYRNKIAHFSVELDIAVVSNLLSESLDPLLLLLASKLDDVNFTKIGIPEIRKIAQPVLEFSEQIRREIVDNALRATENALPPQGSRAGGIVWQAAGSGLETSVVSYINQAKHLKGLRDKPVIVVADRTHLAEQIYRRLSDPAFFEKSINVSLPGSKTVLAENLELSRPNIIVSTIQKFDSDILTIDKECLLIGYSLHSFPERLVAIFPNATRILFTSVLPPQNSQSWVFFGDLVSMYDLKQAIRDGVALPINVEHREIKDLTDYSPYKSEESEVQNLLPSFRSSRMSMEFIHNLAQDIVQHFEERQKKFTGKGIVVVSDIETGIILSNAIAMIRAGTEFVNSVKTI
jgi:hypothetical protein